jgi:tetratricopeptide (TPR) repeat protein
LIGISSVRADAGRFREALAAAEQAYELGADLSAHERMHASFQVMWTAQAAGEWDRVTEILPWHVDAAAAEPDVSCPNVRGGPPLGGTILAWRGEVERAVELAPVDETARWRDTMFDRSILARYAVLVGRNDLAADITDKMAIEPDRAYYPDGLEPFMEALVELGEDDRARQFVDEARRLSATTRMLGPIASRTEALLLLKQPGHRDRARELLEQALDWFEELAVPFEAARTREALADLVDEPRRTQLLAAALETYEQLGARPFAERVRTSLDRRNGKETQPA